MAFSNDFSQDKPRVSELIPANTVVAVEMTYAAGGANLEGWPQDGALTVSKAGDSKYLKAEFTILRGPYRGRKFWANMTVEGGKVDEKGNSIAVSITRSTIRSILDSSAGLSSKDESAEAAAKRKFGAFPELQRRRFVCKVAVEKGKDGYADKNGLGQVLTVDHKDYPKTDAELDNPKIAAVAKDAPPAPAWGQQAATAPVATVAQVQATTPGPVANQQANGNQSSLPDWAKPAA